MSNDKRQYGYRMQLFCMTGYNLTLRSTGEVLGTEDDADIDSHVEISSGGDISHVRIFGLNSKLYLCFKNDGRMYGEEDPSNEGTIFIENFQGLYSTYRSKMDPGWYLGIKKNGSMKIGTKNAYGRKSVKFLPRRL
ncbi:fibroblast growth factor 1 [Leptinotarsa decemlineata]|uniref:fibroblast growth factor 1 n=1 Tax=Leptinotarsa decemlineata TaxID=7539 RepID=UPI000C252D85|nr:fibroblast growth factor 1-like [Leptinotarsa decemlineata]XP_023024743.1 fibroblast growth factor 1-like [Leptinotarsa decemlineata]XP_023024744.1 fibroblast growth factor 1-like [Leptinotarsa decemlineata]